MLNFFNQHPALSFLFTGLFTAIVNFFIWFFTSKNWEDIEKKNPRLAAFFQIMKSAGFNPVNTLKYLYVLITGKPYPEPPAPAPAPAAKSGSDPGSTS